MGIGALSTPSSAQVPDFPFDGLTFFRPDKVVPGTVGLDPNCIECPGDISVKFHFDLPPTQDDYDTAVDQMERASKMLCDATDGNLRIANVDFTLGDEMRNVSDVWWIRHNPGITYAQGKATFGLKQHTVLFGPPPGVPLVDSGIRADFIAHELGHLILGLGDEYPAYGVGPAFENTHMSWPFTNMFGQDLYWGTLPPFEMESRHSIMQQLVPQVCVNAAGETPSLLDPMNVPRHLGRCLVDADCLDPSFPLCGAGTGRALFRNPPPLHSEIGTHQGRQESRLGDGDTLECPAQKETREVVVIGQLDAFEPAVGCGSTRGGGAATVEAGEECDTNSPLLVCGGGTSGVSPAPVAPCDAVTCRYVRSNCPTLSLGTCGDAALDGGEECDGAEIPSSCPALGYAGGALGCSPTCHFDTSQCLGGDRADAPTLAGAAAGWARLTLPDVRDASSDNALARHRLFIDVASQGRSESPSGIGPEYTLVVGMPGEEFADTQSDYVLLARWDVQFDAATDEPIAVNRQPYTLGDPLKVVIGSETQVADRMELDTGEISLNPRFVVEPSGAFENGALPLEIEFVLDRLTTDGNSFFIQAYHRHGSLPPGTTLPGEDATGNIVPQDLGGLDIPVHDLHTDEALCALSYNQVTQRFEGTAETFGQWYSLGGLRNIAFIDAVRDNLSSNWERIEEVLNDAYGVVLPDGNNPEDDGDTPEPEPSPRCDEPIRFGPSFSRLDAQRAADMVFVLDRSGSMKAAVPQTREGVTRLDFVKAAARAFLWNEARRADSPALGVIWFNEEADVRFPNLPEDPFCPPYPFPCNESPELVLPMPRLTPAGATPPAEIFVGTVIQQNFLDSRNPAAQPLPEGGTSTVLALGKAREMLEWAGTSAGPRAVYLLTDGEEPLRQLTTVALRSLKQNTGAVVHTITTALDDGAQSGFATAALAGGSSNHFPDPVDLPGAFFENLARVRGESLSYHFMTPPDRITPVGTGENAPIRAFYEVEVEQGAKELSVLVSAAGGTPIDEADLPPLPEDADIEDFVTRGLIDPWRPGIVVEDPSGVLRSIDGTEDAFFRAFSYSAPEPGTWTISVDVGERNEHKFAAKISNPDVFCSVSADLSRTDAGGPVIVRASATDGFPLGTGADFSAEILRPDDTRYALDIEYDEIVQQYLGEFPPSEFRGRGGYKILARCDVGPDVKVHPGETFNGSVALPPEQASRPARRFAREPSESFYLALDESAAVPTTGTRAGDCDLDGIPNEDEPTGDFDGDGLDDICDGDADNDDVPDGHDPNPRDPNTPNPQQCSAVPSSVACCNDVWSCNGSSKWVLYANETLDLRDGARVSGSGGDVSNVISSGEVLIGIEAEVENVYASDSVAINHRAIVSGDVFSGGPITFGSDVELSGTEHPQAALSIPQIGEYDVVFPPPTESVSLEPDTNQLLSPGSYGNVSVKSRAKLYLTAGVYYFESLQVNEPDASIITYSARGAPTYVFVKNSFTHRGSFSDSAGKKDHLLVGYFGTATAMIETPYLGTFVAPSAHVSLKPLNGAEHEGSFFGKSIEVDAGVVIRHVPFPFSWKPVGVQVPIPTEQPAGDGGTGAVSAMLSFDDPSREWSGSLYTGLSTEATHGPRALSVTTCGWQTIDSPLFDTTELDGVGETVEISIFIPESVSNPSWVGTLELQGRSSGGGWHSAGQVDLTPLGRGDWTTTSFSVPQALRDLLLNQAETVQLRLVVNTGTCSVPILLDHVRFGGAITLGVSQSGSGWTCAMTGAGRHSSQSVPLLVLVIVLFGWMVRRRPLASCTPGCVSRGPRSFSSACSRISKPYGSE